MRDRDRGPTDEVIAMLRDRPATRVWLALAEPADEQSFDDLARQAGLEPLGRAWVGVDAAHAHRFLVSILHKDLAYKSVVMPAHRAGWLAEEFLCAFGRFNVRFATQQSRQPRRLSLRVDTGDGLHLRCWNRGHRGGRVGHLLGR